MSVHYSAVHWSSQKKTYDLIMLGGVVAYLLLFMLASLLLWPGDQAISPMILLIRAFSTCAILLLHIILAIGPLARICTRFVPLLYNRRHMGVTFFVLALIHAFLAILWYQGFGDLNPIVSLFVSNPGYGSFVGFPFETLGFLSLLIVFVMAATSHDFWLKNLSAPVWKAIHMLVYLAYALLIMHVTLGAIQSELSMLYPVLLGLGALSISGLHIYAGVREWRQDSHGLTADDAAETAWVRVGSVDDIADNRAKIIRLQNDDRVAVFRYDNRVSAVGNACAHQNGPLGEGKIVDGCITCPWHGYQYLPASGQSPAPFDEKIPTYKVKLEGRIIFIDPAALPAGTATEPAVFLDEPDAISIQGMST